MLQHLPSQLGIGTQVAVARDDGISVSADSCRENRLVLWITALRWNGSCLDPLASPAQLLHQGLHVCRVDALPQAWALCNRFQLVDEGLTDYDEELAVSPSLQKG